MNRDPAGFQPATTPTELMDTDPVSFKEFDDYPRDLERINVLTLAYRPTLLWLKRAPSGFSSRAADIGSRRRRWRHVAAVEEMGAREEFEARSSLARFPGWESP